MKQSEAFEVLKTGYNVFLTGAAGCGKTFLLNQYIGYLKEHGIDPGVTASTGIASTHINGRTIHSWCGMGIEQNMTSAQIKKLTDKEQLWERIRYAKVLIIDEISMLNASRLDLVDRICREFRENSLPFGGIQTILCGDFFQLPPVTRTSADDGRFVVHSRIWQSMGIKVCYIEEQYRQEDKTFLKVLNDIRANNTDAVTRKILTGRLNKPVGFKIKPTKLHTHNSNVDAYNQFELGRLKGKETIYQMHTEGVPHLVETLKESCLAPERLALKKGTVVMFVKNNFDRGYVNGTLGKVKGFDKDSDYPLVETVHGVEIIAYPEKWTIEDGNKILASISQVPLRLAWAITVHKSQGMSLDCAEIDLSKTFEYGMGYVALSRVRFLSGIKLLGLNDMALQVNKDVVELDKQLYQQSKKDLTEFNQLDPEQKLEMQEEFVRQPEEKSE
jgi:ATP-dependent DNA helicase PIF1